MELHSRAQSDVATALSDSLDDKQSVKGALHTVVDPPLNQRRGREPLEVSPAAFARGSPALTRGLGNVVFAPVDALDSGAD